VVVDQDILGAFRLWTRHGGSQESVMHEGWSHFEDMERKGETGKSIEDFRAMVTIGWRWAESAFVDLVCGHKYAAALMCTDSTDADIVIPWSGVRVLVPNGLLDVGDRRYSRLYFARDLGNENRVIFVMSESGWLAPQRKEPCAHTIMFADAVTLLRESVDLYEDDNNPVSAKADKERAMMLAKRLFIGLIHTICNTNNFQERSGNCKTGRDGREGPPQHRVFVCGYAIKVDCRPKVRQWIEGTRKGAAPTVQHLVRGHYKRQVVGVGRIGRKVIWVEPYWRGPEDAPIMVRPYKLGSLEQKEVG